MKKKVYWLLIVLFSLSCNSNEYGSASPPLPQDISILSLGDSYTIGTSVCESCKFPEQLKVAISDNFNRNVLLDIIATSGWTTSDLLEGIENQETSSDFDLVTLLIGVNNQFQGIPFDIFEMEFDLLITEAISKANNNPSRLIVLSIPDYAYTPFGNGFGNQETTSAEIDSYNTFIENYCTDNGISYLNITDISRQGFNEPELIASDGLHLSEEAYSRFVERLLPLALEKLD